MCLTLFLLPQILRQVELPTSGTTTAWDVVYMRCTALIAKVRLEHWLRHPASVFCLFSLFFMLCSPLAISSRRFELHN